MTRNVTEIKRHLNKPTERYECDLIRARPGHAVLRYVSDRKFASTKLGVTFPPGCITLALYWEDRPYVFWSIFSPDRELLGYLVHICREVNISDGNVSYLDMLLDLWFYPDGRHVVLDRDEVKECIQSGLLTERDGEYIEEAEETALADFDANARQIRAFASSLDFSTRPK